ncbi:hypothetical protein DFH08DRAFT_1082094 [Mycena albidolilacea]|uniref:Molybdate-anion transporter n=1 Tax=Mycena albidolilacea TaxID=1033008 RepID=A0AAD6ZVM8_9AGAR|nr:hypothetical protein DFH08DRAFT_1082094 [Mycena albidolilacea]
MSASTSHALPQSDLSTIMGRATLVNGLVATGAGVFSNQLVGFTGSFASPFIASGALLILAWAVIRGSWIENYDSTNTDPGASDPLQLARLRTALRIVREDSRLLVLGLTQTCFEGSMYLFVFLWVPVLQEHSLLGMMLGSVLYTYLVAISPESSLMAHAKLSSAVCALALAVSISQPDERARFWVFCVFEACVGLYYPLQDTLPSALIANEHRETLSSLFRVPLNVFVVGVADARGAVLTASALMLGFSSVMTGAVIVSRVEGGRWAGGSAECSGARHPAFPTRATPSSNRPRARISVVGEIDSPSRSASLPHFLSLPALIDSPAPFPSGPCTSTLHATLLALPVSTRAWPFSALLPSVPPHLPLPSSRADADAEPFLPYSLLTRRRQAARGDPEATSLFLPHLMTCGRSSRA